MLATSSGSARRPRSARRSRSDRRATLRRVALWLGASVAVLLLLLTVLIATAPRWGAGRVELELEQRMGRRLDARVEIGELEASWSGARLRDVRLTAEGAKLTIDTVDVTLDRRALWSGRLEVIEAVAVGGRMTGTRAGLEALAGKLRAFGEREADEQANRGWLRRRTRLTPTALELRGLAFDLSDDRGRRATGELAATAEPFSRRVELRVTSLIAELGLGRPLRAATLRTSIEQRDGELRFPITVDLAGMAADVDAHIAVAGVHGSITAHDRHASELSVDLKGGFADVDATSALSGRDLWSVEGRFARDLSVGTVTVDMQAFELGRVPDVLARLPVVDSDSATVGGRLQVAFGEGAAKLDGKLDVAGLNISHALLARDVVRDVGFEVDIDARVDPAARRLQLERLAITRGGVQLLAHGELLHPSVREQRRYQVALEIPAVGCQEVLDAIPRELVPGLVGFELDGQFSARVAIDADFAKLDELILDADVRLDACRVRRAPARASAERLNGPFVHRVTMRDGRTRRVSLVPGSVGFTPLDQISRYMVEAVLTTEDGSFRKHDGFNRTQLEVALRRNLQSGKVRLGASTITMQMVKNVLLSHERTLSRKLQELYLTWWVEQSLGKHRIMELYLNVIEFGPGIYGVTDAARHYFGKLPSELGSLEAAMLAAMLPSPVRRHVAYCNGGLDERFEAKVRWIHDLMLERGRITQIEHDVYAAQGIRLDLLERGDPALCLEEIETLMAGSVVQRALSGLLGDGEESAEFFDWATDMQPSQTWGMRPPLPGIDPSWQDWSGEPGGEAPAPGMRLEPRDDSWMVPNQPVDDDPRNADAPGRPAMDELP